MTLSYQCRKMLIKWYCLLLLTSFILLAELLNCNEKQYEWPNTNPKWCCNRCKPGEHMMTRCTEGGVDTECVSCGDGYYMDEYNYELQCQPCTQCTRDNMELKHDCTKTRNTVCRCQVGFQCNNDQCEQCEKIPRPSTTTITTTTAVTTSTKPKGHTKPFQDTHLHVDGPYQHLLIPVFGTSRRAQIPVSAQRRRRCRCQSRRCPEERQSVRKKSERDGGKRFHMSVWLEY